jgi:hypothetical protein
MTMTPPSPEQISQKIFIPLSLDQFTRADIRTEIAAALRSYGEACVQEFVDAINEDTPCGHKLGWQNAVGDKDVCEVCQAHRSALLEATKVASEFDGMNCQPRYDWYATKMEIAKLICALLPPEVQK